MDSHLSQEEVERISQIAHAVNRALCLQTGLSSETWEEATADTKESMAEGIIAASNFVAQSQGRQMNPEESHNSWMTKKLRAGWRYGPAKDEAGKVHPCLLPWAELPRDERLKDVLFSGIVHFYSVFREEPDAA
jgi:hypothetical protein